MDVAMTFTKGGKPLTVADLHDAAGLITAWPGDVDLCAETDDDGGVTRLWVAAVIPEPAPPTGKDF